MNKKEKQTIAKQLGSLGGKATVKKLGKEHMAALGRKGMFNRWSKKNGSK